MTLYFRLLILAIIMGAGIALRLFPVHDYEEPACVVCQGIGLVLYGIGIAATAAVITAKLLQAS